MKKFFNTLLLFVSLLSSCNKFIEVDDPRTQIEQGKIFQDEEASVSAISGLYYQLSSTNTILSGLTTIYAGLYGDEIYNTTANDSYDPFFTVSLQPTTSQLNDFDAFWKKPYNFIYHANAIIEALEFSPIDVETKKQLRGEALFIRSVTLFYLTNFYGDVPLTLTSSYQTNDLLPRENQEKVLERIVDDLKEASELLKDQYLSSTRLRANKYAALALLARVYLYQQKWQLAVDAATQVINSATYSLESLNNIFLNNSKEAILQFSMPPTSTSVTPEATVFIPSTTTARPAISLSDTLIKSFENGDTRWSSWTQRRTVSGVLYTYPYKFKIRTTTSGQAKPELVTVLRLAEQFLIKAEGNAQLDRLLQAIDDVDKIRLRAGLSKIANTKPSISKDELLNVIQHERQIELFCEYGHRFFDLRRTGKLNAVLLSIKPNWTAYKSLWPIPNKERMTNPNLTQNQGY